MLCWQCVHTLENNGMELELSVTTLSVFFEQQNGYIIYMYYGGIFCEHGGGCGSGRYIMRIVVVSLSQPSFQFSDT